jgi:hypothetical protein
MELAIINGTYRDGNKLQQKINQILIPNAAAATNPYAAFAVANAGGMRSPPTQLGQPLIISPRLPTSLGASQLAAAQATQAVTGATLLNGSQLIAAAAAAAAGQSGDPNQGLYYTTLPTGNLQTFYSMPDGQIATLEYPNGLELSQAGKFNDENLSFTRVSCIF